MLRGLSNYFAAIPAVFIDGTLYVLIAVFGVIQTVFTTEEAYKYVNPHVLFWGKASFGAMLAGVTALKMFRSSSYADHQEIKKGNTDRFGKV